VRLYLLRARQDPAWGWSMPNVSVFGPVFGAGTCEAATATIAPGIRDRTFQVTDVNVGRDLLLGATSAAMRTVLCTDAGALNIDAVARQILRGLGVEPGRAAELCRTKLPARLSSVNQPPAMSRSLLNRGG